ncbi:MAG TPA: DinB family protein [Terriglobales bacterium]|nr:DinB family protein [Terriglobales bacterium]
MRKSLTQIAVAAVVFAATLALAQEKPAAPEKSAGKENVTKPATESAAREEKPEPIANPVTSTVRQLVERQSKNIVAAAEEMPAEKYDFHPTEAQMTFAHLIAHIIDSNNFLCSRISDQSETRAEVKDTDTKAKLVQALKASFDYCSAALDKTDDSKLGDTVTLFRGRKGPRAAALIGLTNDFADHYGTAAMYLRLNGMLPPTAQK